MWVYGDLTRRVAPAELLAEVEADLAAGETVSALIGFGQLAQGVADAEFEARGWDARSPRVDPLMAALTALAGAGPATLVLRQAQDEGRYSRGRSGDRACLSGAERLRQFPGPLAELVEARGPPPPLDTLQPLIARKTSLEVRVPEGYAFYALHPALYAAAARQLPPGDWRVIGIRSIGTSLAAVVAAALGAQPPVTVRPTGHPFARELRLSPELEAEWAAHTGPFAIVDEGPGLSGSSFGAVADALERLGVGRERIAFLPGHGGELGPQASPEHRARWARALRPTAGFEDVVLPALQAGVEALVGPATRPLRDISGGAWRELRSDRPPVHAAQERRKFLHETAHGRWLVKFAGLGRVGRAKLERARALHAAGFTPEPAGLVKGFLVERWIEAPPLSPGRVGKSPPGAASDRGEGSTPPHPQPFPLEGGRERLHAYLAFRARFFPAEREAGADLPSLAEMLRVNAEEALGPAAGEAVRPWADRAPLLQARVRRVYTDGRLHGWEWLAASDGGWLKADAVDHSEAHDLIGAQDVTWDVAGAELELDLTETAAERVRAELDADPELLAFMRLAYPAFQLGLWTMAADAQAAWAEEAARARAQADGYARRLAALLGVDPQAAGG